VLESRARSRELIEIGERIRQRRKDSHLSQEAFAEKAGISVNTVSRIEGGQAAMSVEIFSKIVAILEADANELLGKSKGKLQGKPHLEKLFCRMWELKPKEQEIAVQTMTALIEGLEGKIHKYGGENRKVPHIC
jgi:transcriptional regulator with XRE-family HTH domain